ncbi:MAG: cbb3-type cytochrome c oxidase subunit I [Phycisphaerae bacterium]|nr:cbb3-type cytochrome c oxidase subunit I [Phycisphaerae bacterium]
MKKDSAAKLLIYCSLGYLALGMTLGIVTAMKLIWPAIGDFEIMSFGRIRTVHTNMVMFGWLLQADLGLLFFILPRILHTKLFSEKLGMLMAGLLNVALLGGFIGILTGHMKNVEYGELPRPFDILIVVCWVLFAVNVFGTIAQRKVKYLYVTVWYSMGAVIWTTFVYLTGNFVSQLPGIQGVNQANLIWFYVHNAVGLIFTPLGVAAAYYLIPKSLNTPLYSHRLSLVGFWVISFTYVWTGAHHMINGPISYWLQTVAILFSFSLIIPVVAVVTNFFGTFGAAPRQARMAGAVPKLLLMGTIYYLFTCLQGPFQAIRHVNVIVSKTDWVVGHAHMALLGAFSFYAMAGVYYAIPRIIGKKLYSEKLANVHFWLMTLATLPFFGILWLSGVIQGFLWLNPENTFLETLRIMRPYHGIRMWSGALILASVIVFIYNIMETCAGKGGDLESTTT